MKVVQVSTYDVVGGAAIAAHRLHRGLLAAGCDSTMFVAERSGVDPAVAAFAPPTDPLAELRRRLRRRRLANEMGAYAGTRPPTAGYFTDDRTQYGAAPLRQLPPADVVNLHWVAGFLDLPSCLPRLAGGAPVVWTLHDENATTGGCHYTAGCGRSARGCGACPQLGSSDERDLSARIWKRKRRAYEALRAAGLRLVTPSAWLAERARRSALLGGLRVEVIPYGVDTDVFAPGDRAAARRALGLPADGRIVLCAAVWLAERRKGLDVLAAAMASLAGDERLCLVTFGHALPQLPPAARHLHLGFVADERTLAAAYAAADLTALASLEDNLPNTILESLACGTPVAAFAVGGIPEAVRPGSTGCLAAGTDSEALAGAIAGFFAEPGPAARMSATCREVALREYSLPLQAARYRRLYEEVVAS